MLRRSCLLALAVAVAPFPAQASRLTMEDRVQAQRAIERVAWTHREGPKPEFERTAASATEERVRRTLAESVALERVWGEPLTASRLRRELDRMARASRMPERLREIFRALHEDPLLLQEGLARPALVGRLVRARYAWDPGLHASARREAEARAREGERVIERDDGFLVEKALPDGTVRTVAEVRKQPFDLWWGRNAHRFDPGEALTVGDAALGAPIVDPPWHAASCVPDDTWDGGLQSGSPAAPRQWHAAVWTGSELVVWGGIGIPSGTGYVYRDDGARYDPATDTWAAIADSPLMGRAKPSAVWTGSAVMIWGGAQFPKGPAADYVLYRDGATYDPVADAWTPVSSAGAPSGRWDAPATWTGTTVVVFGGQIKHPSLTGQLAPALDGKRYDPATNTWSPMALSPLTLGTFASGAQVGGRVWYWGSGQGAGYDPVADDWVSMAAAGAPSSRARPVVLGTDTEILVWGGGADPTYFNDGRLYDPSTSTWRPLTGLNAPSPRTDARAAWTGAAVLVWGGKNASGATWDGGLYDPVGDVWSAAEMRGRPGARDEFSLTWSGTEAIVFGDIDLYFGDAKRYNPSARSWAPLGYTAPPSRSDGAHAWTGYEWVHVGERDAGRYDPALDLWTATPSHLAGNPTRAVWTGSHVVYFGGTTSGFRGGRYDPVADAWSAMSQAGAPSPRVDHTLVAAGSRAIVWGGTGSGGATNSGGVYDPVADTWTPTSASGAPAARSYQSAVWTGSAMIIWGGRSISSALGDGASYDPVSDTWSPIAAGPAARWNHAAAWTGSKMVVWGGYDGTALGTGGQYDPVAGGWSAVATTGAPSARFGHTAVWTGQRLIVWGGAVDRSGGRYDPVADSWEPTSLVGAPAARWQHAAVWTGSLMLVWGGGPPDGGRYALGHTLDDDGDGFSECAGDCDDWNASAWAAPPEVSGLSLAPDKTTVSWDPVAGGAVGPPLYTLFRSPIPAVFVESECPLTASAATTFADPDVPAAGQAFYYLVSAVNGCARHGVSGAGSGGSDRGATCRP